MNWITFLICVTDKVWNLNFTIPLLASSHLSLVLQSFLAQIAESWQMIDDRKGKYAVKFGVCVQRFDLRYLMKGCSKLAASGCLGPTSMFLPKTAMFP